MSVVRSIGLFVVAAIAEIGGAWLVWQGCGRTGASGGSVRDRRLAAYGFIATFQDDDRNLGRLLAAYGGIFVAGSMAWGVVMDGFRPDRFDLIGRPSASPVSL